MKKLLWLIVLLVIVAGGLILFFFWEDSTPRWKPKSAVRTFEEIGQVPSFEEIEPQKKPKRLVDLGPAPEETKTLVDLGPAPTSPIIGIVFLVYSALIVAGIISLVVMLVYRLWSRCSMQGKYLCMVWLIIVAFVLIGLFPPVYGPVRGVRSGEQNSFAFLVAIPDRCRISYRTLLVEWAVAIAIPAGVIIILRIKNRQS